MIFTNIGLEKLFRSFFKNESISLKLRLYKNVLPENPTLSDITECDFSGYYIVDAVPENWVITSGGAILCTYTVNYPSSINVDVKGMYITDSLSANLLAYWPEVFSLTSGSFSRTFTIKIKNGNM